MPIDFFLWQPQDDLKHHFQNELQNSKDFRHTQQLFFTACSQQNEMFYLLKMKTGDI